MIILSEKNIITGKEYRMTDYIMPDPNTASDSGAIQEAIRKAKESGIDCVVIPKKKTGGGYACWEIDRTILLPSDITIVLSGCHLRLCDGVYENIFRSENMYHEETYTIEQEQKNIKIIGIGTAVLDGGHANGLTEATSRKNGLPHVRNNNLILLHNVNGYVIENIRCVNMRWWAINQLYCRNGRLSHIDFFNGECRPNQDGINVRIGCHSILIEDITGRTGDDSVALSAFCKSSERDFAVAGKDADIHDVTIRNVHTETRQTVAALRCCDGAKIYRINIENISDAGKDYMPYGVLRIGENNYYRERPNILGEVREITARGIYSSGAAAVFLGSSLKDSHLSDIHASGRTLHAVSTYTPEMVFPENGCHIMGGVDMENVLIENVFYSGTADGDRLDDSGSFANRYTFPDKAFSGCALDFRCMREGDRLQNVVFRNIHAPSEDKIGVFADGIVPVIER